MKTSNQCFSQQFTTPQCCFIPFFSQNIIPQSNSQRNTNGIIPSLKKNQSIVDQKQIIYKLPKQKNSNYNSKRSISSIKAIRRTSNRINQETQNNIPYQKRQLNAQKTKSSLRSSEILQRYFSPKAQHRYSLALSPMEDQKINQPNFIQQNIQNNINLQLGNQNRFFKHQEVVSAIQFSKPYNPQFMEEKSSISENHIKFNISSFVKNQELIKTDQKFQIQSTATHFNSSQRSKNQQKVQKIYGVNQTIEIQNKNNNPEEILKNSQQPKIKVNQNNFSMPRKTSLQKVLEQKKQQNIPSHQLLEVPVNPFKHIQSFVMAVKKQENYEDHQKQYDSIKTKGRVAQSMLQHTKDMTMTKKVRKNGKRRNQTGLNDLENMTVTSEYEQEEDRDRCERIEQSAVLLNFFNPPKDMKDRLDLSKFNKPVNGKSGFY